MKYNYQMTCRASDMFPGFYESLWLNSDTLYNLNENDNVPDGYSYELCYGKYMKDMSDSWCTAVFDNVPHDIIKSFEFKEVRSPSYYNFETDKVHATVEFDYFALNEYCYDSHRDEFDKYLHKFWSCYDGFISFIPNNLIEFEQNEDLDVMIEFYLRQELEYSWDTLNYDIVLDVGYEALYNNLYLVDKNDKKVDYAYYNDAVHPLDTEEKIEQYNKYLQDTNPAQLTLF